MIIKTTPTIDTIEKIAFVGNVIPHAWYKTIRYQSENGKIDRPHLEAIMILADLIYWYKPRLERDEHTGELIGKFKRFAADKLQRNYNQLSEMFGLSYKVVREAVKFLEDLGAVVLEVRDVRIEGKGVLQNVMFIDLNPDRIFKLTYPEKANQLPNSETTDYPIGQSANTQLGGTYTRQIPTDKKENIYIHAQEKNENLTINNSLLKETTNHQHHVAAGGEKFSAAEKVEKPNFLRANRENLKKEFIEKPKYDFDGIRNLPLERGYNQSYKNTFEKKMKKAGFLTNTLSAEIINKNFPDFWTKYIVELETAVNKGEDIGLSDTLHVINNFPQWFEAKTQGKETKQTYQSKGSYSKQQPQSTVAQTVNLEKTIAKQAMQTTDSKRVGYYKLQGIYNDLVENDCQKHALPFETFQISFKEKAGHNIYVTDHAPNEHSQNLINNLFSQFSNLKK